MFYVSREFVIPANSDKILKFLDDDNRLLPSSYHFSDVRDFRADYRCRRNGNKFSVYRYAYFTPSGKLAPKDYLDDPNGPGYEVIQFEVTQFFDNRSNVKGMYESFDPETDDPDIKKMFLTMIVRLAASSGTDSLAVSAQKELDELTRESGAHWGWTEWRDGPTAGSKERAFALIPNTPLSIKDDTEPKNDAIELKPESLDPDQSLKNNFKNEVFVSYAWGGESELMVDELEQAFTKRGIQVVRDKKDLGYKGSIKAFEQRIGRGQCVVLVISDKYLRSEHCMYELVEVGEKQNIRDRIFPIVLVDAQIYKAEHRVSYIQYWENEVNRLNQAVNQVGVKTNIDSITADLNKYARIRANFDHLTEFLSDMNALTPEVHKASGFSTLIDAVERAMGKNKTV